MVDRLQIAIHPSVGPFAQEAKYALLTITRLAGFAAELSWAQPQGNYDIYYGPTPQHSTARLCIRSSQDFRVADRGREPSSFCEAGGLGLLSFDQERGGVERTADGRLLIENDLVRASFWLLSGAMDTFYPRDRWDNLQIQESFLVRNGILQRPLVSEYAQFLRDHFTRAGKQPLPLPWVGNGKTAAFSFSHDVDYPEIIKSIECVRLLRARGLKAFASIPGILRGTNHFWKFADWIEFEKKFGARPAFYFSAVQGSLAQYAAGTPDCFYDIGSRAFRDLFKMLRDEGCEIGLHASYNAYRSSAQLAAERRRLQEASGALVEGTRHHYWRLNPAAPEETLGRHQAAGFSYDSSLGFELFPGWRRGACHPFHVFDPASRRELNILQIPPAWMDDHFDRRLAINKIASPDAHARALLAAAEKTNGMVVVDYHARGMNNDFYPRYGAWLQSFLAENLSSQFVCHCPADIAKQFRAYEAVLQSHSVDRASAAEAPVEGAPHGAAEPCTIELLQPEHEAAWESFVQSHPDATVYHSLAWRAVTQEGLGHQPFYLCATSASGQCVGVLPLFLVKGVFGKRLVSVPMRDRGGVLARDEAVASLLLERAVALKKETGASFLELRSMSGLPVGVARKHGFVRASNWVTSRIDLTPGRDALWKALDRDAIRWAIGKAGRQGVAFGADSTLPGVRIFYGLFSKTRQKMGIPVFPWKFFEAMWRHLIAPGRGSLFLVRKGAEPIHAMICFHSGESFIPAYAAPQNAWRKLYPNEFMFWHTIEWAVDRGFRWYDFGADSRLQAGLLFFKSKWGSVQHPMAYEYHLNDGVAVPNFDSSSRAYSLARKAWRMIPKPVSVPLGGWVTRQLS